MKKAFTTMLQGALCACTVCASLLSTPATAQIEVVIAPPAEFLATTTPVYFEGHAAYWYGNRWVYRNGPAWGYYRNEPGFLHDYRGHHSAPARQFYGRAHEGGYRRR